MKTFLIVSIYCFGCLFLSLNSTAQGIQNYQNQVDRINSLEEGEDLWGAFYETRRLASELYADLRLGHVVVDLDRRFTEIFNEKIVERYTSDETESASASFFSILGAGGISMSSRNYLSYDTTKMLSQNAEEAAYFRTRYGEGEMQEVRAQLADYVRSNIDKIVLLKEVGQKAIDLWSVLRGQGQNVNSQDIQQVVKMVVDLHFIGRQQITTCIQKNYTARERTTINTKEAGASGSILFFLFRAGGDLNSSRTTRWRQFPHTETECDSTLNRMTARPGDVVYEYQLSLADQQLLDWLKVYFLTSTFDLSNKPVYPTFGSPFYNN